MRLQDDLLRTNGNFLLGRWLSYVAPWSSSPQESERLNYDARSILTTWGNRSASEAGNLHEYGNKDWAGLTSDYYMPRWKIYFDSLTKSLATGEPAAPIDWYASGDRWNHSHTHYTATPEGDSYAAALEIARQLHLTPGESK
jgi:alpha-N-acetylglucosaminidase